MRNISPARSPGRPIHSKKDFAVSCVIFGAAVLLLVTHAQTGLTVATIGVGIGLVSLLTAGREAGKMLRQVDYKTLLFFIGLFVVVGGLEKTGILGLIANFIAAVSGDNLIIMVAIVLWISAVASAFVDNIPLCGYHDPRDPVPGGNTGREPVDFGLGVGPGHGHRRQRNPHRCIGQRGGPVHRRQERPYGGLGPVL